MIIANFLDFFAIITTPIIQETIAAINKTILIPIFHIGVVSLYGYSGMPYRGWGSISSRNANTIFCFINIKNVLIAPSNFNNLFSPFHSRIFLINFISIRLYITIFCYSTHMQNYYLSLRLIVITYMQKET